MKKVREKIVIILMLFVLIFNNLVIYQFNKVNAIEEKNTNRITEYDNFAIRTINDIMYASQTFDVNYDENKSYDLSISNFPEGTKILDGMELTEITQVTGERFIIIIPIENIKGDVKGIINVGGETYNFFKRGNQSSIKANTLTKDGKIRKNIKMEIRKWEGEVFATATSDENGLAIFRDLYPGRYEIFERDENNNIIKESYVFLDLTFWDNRTIYLRLDKQIIPELTIENEIKKGILEIYVYDNTYEPKKPMNNIEFEIRNYNTGDLIQTVVSDEKGFATSKLPVDIKYKVSQKTKLEAYEEKNYIVDFTFNENNQKKVIEFTNKLKTNIIKINKVDKDNNDIKLKGVEFEIYDEYDNLIEKIITDENGVANTSILPINKIYKIKEVKTLNNYILDETVVTVKLTKEGLEINNPNVVETEKLSSLSDFVLIENKKIHNLLPKLGC